MSCWRIMVPARWSGSAAVMNSSRSLTRASQRLSRRTYEHRPALDEVVQFQTGLAFMTGPIGQPLRAGASVIDIVGAMFGFIAAQAALRERDTTGKKPSAFQAPYLDLSR